MVHEVPNLLLDRGRDQTVHLGKEHLRVLLFKKNILFLFSVKNVLVSIL